MKALQHNHIALKIGALLLLCLGYYLIGYHVNRPQTERLLLAYAGLILMSWPWWRIQQFPQEHTLTSWRLDLFAGIILRVLLIFSWPKLSQDVYRFLWDGGLLAQGISPYAYTPNMLVHQQELVGLIIPNSEQLFNDMGALSAGNFSNYPPLKQLIFALPHWLGVNGILAQISILRIVIILADLGVFFLGRRLLLNRGLNPQYINWYFLNPLIILELSGNVHFEGVMAVAILASLLFLTRKKYLYSGILLSIGVGIKLIPLMFVPVIGAFIVRDLDKNNRIKPLFWFVSGLIGTLGLTFFPLLSTETLTNYVATTGLWFTKFEFNASIYYLLRWLGFQWKGYNLIAQIGPALSVFTAISILYLSYRVWVKKSNLYPAMMGAILIHLLFATTVHPWYWTTVLVLSIMAQSRIGLLGSMLVFLSYTAYDSAVVQEKSLWLSIEYILLFAYIFWELKNSKATQDHCAKTSSS